MPLQPLQDKGELKAALNQLFERFDAGADVRILVRDWAMAIDAVLIRAWQQLGLDQAEAISLLAVGGYGRGELHPQSDVDVLVLHDGQASAAQLEQISAFITYLWDLGLDVGSSVRSLADCVTQAEADITIATNLMESRTLMGDAQLREKMLELTGPDRLWPGKAFFVAKRDEQRARHAKHNNTAYNLEPDLKNAPGGLRDIQTIGWVAKRHFGEDSLRGLVAHGFLTEEEFNDLDTCQAQLWRFRFALNKISTRNETRILFDYQRRLAELFGYSDTKANRGVEQLMQGYYRAAARISMLNELLLQYFEEVILGSDQPDEVTAINSRFQLRNGALQVTRDDVFTRTPSALIELFVHLGNNADIYHVRASTIRLVMQNLYLINDNYRNDIRNKSLFMELMRCRDALFSSLTKMKRYGVLGLYIPAFGAIIGKMQYDLFHIYTVDAHTLRVIKNMRRFRYPETLKSFPVVAEVAQNLPKIELLYLAGLFHDIAKGRGGDHSELGATDAREFCLAHGLGKWDASLVSWLTLNHLVMSVTAQKKDVSDPDVINEFARKVGDQVHLDYLYALTVADICATNPTLWNSWRASLLSQLYAQTKAALRRGLVNPIEKDEWVTETRESALEILQSEGVSTAAAKQLWEKLGDEYFLHENAEDIAWHTQAILAHGQNPGPLVLIRASAADSKLHGATQIFVYTQDMPNLFAATVAELDQLHLSVMDARIITSTSHFSLDSYVVLDENNQPITDAARMRLIGDQLRQALEQPDEFPTLVQRRMPRQLKHFDVRTEVKLSNDLNNQHTVVEIVALDRPGLLAQIGKIFMTHGVNLQNARIATLGERAEDVFFLTDAAQQPISDPELCQRLVQSLRQQLDNHSVSAA